MGDQTLTLLKASAVYNRWLGDPRVEFYSEPRNMDAAFPSATDPFAARYASKAVGECWVLAYLKEVRTALVTFDRALHEFAVRTTVLRLFPAIRHKVPARLGPRLSPQSFQPSATSSGGKHSYK